MLESTPLLGANALGDLLADREQEHGFLSWTPDTDQMASILLYAAGHGTRLRDGRGRGIRGVRAAADALRTAGYGAEVDAWLGEHGGYMLLDEGDC